MKKILLLVLVAVSITANAQKLKGSWTGVGNQVDGKSWDIELRFKSDKKISIDYPTLDCSGKWALQKSENNISIFKEEITEGVDLCDQGAEIHVEQVSKNELKVKYYLRSYDNQNPIAEGTLVRKGSK